MGRPIHNPFLGLVVEVLDQQRKPTGFRGRCVGLRMAVIGPLFEISGSGRRLELTPDRFRVVDGEPSPTLPMPSAIPLACSP